MKHYNALLTDQVRSKLTGDCVTAIVAEAFINALPFNPEEMANESVHLTDYAVSMVKAMHPETMLQKALEAADSAKAYDYLTTLESELSVVVEAATQRILNAYTDSNPVPEVVKQAKLDEKDVERFATAGQKVGVNAVAKLVKDKMLDMIKSERESYENAEKLRNEVKDAIQEEKESVRDSLEADDDDKFTEAPVNKDPTPEAEESVVDDQADPGIELSSEDDSVLESYLDVVLKPHEPRNHVSVFSKLQDVCMESILHTGEYYRTVPYDTLKHITLESTFPYFDKSSMPLQEEARNLQVSLEAMNDAIADDNKLKATAKTAFISTICIMTLLEVLKTMHLAKPTSDMVKDFVDAGTVIPNTVDADLDRIESKVDAATGSVKKSVAMGALSAMETEEAKEQLKSFANGFQSLKMPTVAAQESQTRILNKLNAAIEASLEIPERVIRTDSRSTRMREENIANLNYAIKALSRRPAVESVQICLDSRTPMGDDRSMINIDARGLDASGHVVATHGFDFHNAKFMGESIGEAVLECAQFCSFKTAPKATSINYIDGNYTVPVDFQ